MSSWSMGYQTNLPQQYTYSAEQNLLRAKFIFNQKGLAFPELNSDDSDFYFCELGFGQGITLNINAAASGKQTKWYGTDFNPACLSYAQRLAKMGTLQLNFELCVQQTGLTSSNASKRGCLSMNLQGLMPYGTRVRG